MKVVKCDLPSEFEEIEIHTFADEHIGDMNCDMKRLLRRIEYVENTPNAYCVMNGDLMDNATKTSIGDIYNNQLQPMEQLEKAEELFSGLKDKILAITTGNHEARTYRKEGIDMSRLIAKQLQIEDKYSPTSALLFIRFGTPVNNHGDKNRKMCYTLYHLHGSGGGRREGAKATRLADMASIVDADIYLHSHTHLPMVIKQGFHRVDTCNSTVTNVTKLFVNNAANLNYGGYGEMLEFKPSSKDTPVIYLSGKRKEFYAKL